MPVSGWLNRGLFCVSLGAGQAWPAPASSLLGRVHQNLGFIRSVSLALLEIIQDINQLPEAPVLTAVEAKRNSGKINRILILTLFG